MQCVWTRSCPSNKDQPEHKSRQTQSAMGMKRVTKMRTSNTSWVMTGDVQRKTTTNKQTETFFAEKFVRRL